jgi:hypothetical protein
MGVACAQILGLEAPDPSPARPDASTEDAADGTPAVGDAEGGDGPAPDAAQDAPLPPQDRRGVACGASVCDPAGCCFTAGPTYAVRGCASLPAQCMPPNVLVLCDGPEDCTNGDVCCFQYPLITCTPVDKCMTAPNNQTYLDRACHDDGDCDGGTCAVPNTGSPVCAVLGNVCVVPKPTQCHSPS